MIGALAAILVWAQGVSPAADSIAVLARRADTVAVRAAVRAAPDAARVAFRRLQEEAARNPPGSLGAAPLGAAALLADGYAAVWGDSFLLLESDRFRRWSAAQRRTKVRLDSLRLAGNDALGEAGPRAAIRRWRQSARLALAIGDSAGLAAAEGNIGTGFVHLSRLDTAATHLERARMLASLAGDRRTAANAATALGAVARYHGDLRRAHMAYVDAAALRRRIGDMRGLVADYNNLGLLADLVGDPEGANALHDSALALARAHVLSDGEAAALRNLGELAATRGNGREAQRRYDEALAVHRRMDDRFGAALVLRDVGLLRERGGDLRGALTVLRQALREFEALELPDEAALTRADLAGVLALRGDLMGARSELRRAETDARRTGASEEVRAALAVATGDVAARFNDFAAAERAYRRAELLYRVVADLDGLAAARWTRGVQALRREEYARAVPFLAGSVQGYEAAGDRRAAAHTRVLLGFAQLRQGRASAARRAMEQAVRALDALDDPIGRSAALAAVGDLEIELERPAAAESAYAAGIAVLGGRHAPEIAWRLRAGLGGAAEARGALDAAAAAYGEAIGVIERAARPLAGPELRADFLADKAEVYARLARVEMRRGRAAQAFAVSEQLHARRLREVTVAAGAVRPVAWRAVAAALDSGQALVEYLATDEAVLAFVVRPDTILALDLATDRRTIATLVDFARGTLAVDAARARAAWRAPLRRLHDLLIAPLEEAGHLAGTRSLVVVPNAELHYLPFAALMDRRAGDRFLVERYDLESTPSAAIWAERPRARPPVRSVLAMAPLPEALPASTREVAAIGARFGPRATVLVGVEGSLGAFRERAPRADIVHVATRGRVERLDPLSSHISFAAAAGDDGRLEVRDLVGFALPASLVVLSACETALGGGRLTDVPAGDDWVGFVHAFLAAGAAGVVATLWTVSDSASAGLMDAFYMEVAAGRPPAAALASAQRRGIAGGAESPLSWAGFVSVAGGATTRESRHAGGSP